MDPNVYRPLADIQQGQAMQEVGMDSSPTSKWGAIGRLANALAGTYISNSSTSDLAKTIAGGKKSATDQLMAALQSQKAPVPMAPPAMSPGMPASPASGAPMATAPAPVAPDPGSPNAAVAERFPADWSPGTAASPLPADAPSPLDTAQYPAGPNGAPSAVAANAPRGIRNNNPLNIEAGDFTKSQPGFAGSDGRFAKFETPEHGIAAAHKLLDIYDQKHGINTVAGIVNRWAPPSDGNNTMAYAADVAGRMGIDPNAPLPKEMRPQLIAAMARHENGVNVPGADQAPYQVAGPATAAPKAAAADDAELPANAATTAGQPAAAGGLDIHKLMAVLQNPYADDTTKSLAQKLLLNQLTPEKPDWGIVGKDKFGQPVYGYPPSREDFAAQPKATAQPADSLEGLQGQERIDALKKIDQARASQTQAVLEARVPYPTGSRLNPQQQQLKEDVTQTDPNFTAATWLARSNFEKNMASTVPNSFGGQIRSAGTVAKHLGDAHAALPAIESGMLGASNTLPMLNNAKGFLRDQAGDQKYQDAIGHYNTATKGLADEVSNLLAGGHGAEGSKLYWQDRLDISKHSPTEVRGALDEFKSLMMGRVSNVAQEKDRVYGKEQGHTDPLSLFGPKERENMKKITDETYKEPATAAATPAATAAPATVSSKADYDALPSGRSYVAPDGSVRTKK